MLPTFLAVSIVIKGPSDNSTAILIPVGDFKKYKEECNQ